MLTEICNALQYLFGDSGYNGHFTLYITDKKFSTTFSTIYKIGSLPS